MLGGSHADLPLQAHMEQALADVVVEEGISAVFSLRHLSKTEQRKFVTDFAERLYYQKGEDQNRTPLHIVIDECDAYILSFNTLFVLINTLSVAPENHGKLYTIAFLRLSSQFLELTH